MARIFTTTFLFNHEKYNAIVTVVPQQKELLIQVRILGNELDEFIPNGEVSYIGVEGFQALELQKHPVSSTLLKRIDQAIQQHLTQ
jgi:hypothetical protein